MMMWLLYIRLSVSHSGPRSWKPPRESHNFKFLVKKKAVFCQQFCKMNPKAVKWTKLKPQKGKWTISECTLLAEHIEKWCLQSDSQTVTVFPLDWIRCSRSLQAWRPCSHHALWLPPPAVCRRRNWHPCPAWTSPDRLQPAGNTKLTSYTKKDSLMSYSTL